MRIPDLKKLTINAFHTGGFSVVDYANTRIKAIYLKLAKDLKNSQCAAFTCSNGGNVFYLWTNSLKNNGVQKTAFIKRNGSLIALSDIQIENREELFKEMEFNTDITIFGGEA